MLEKNQVTPEFSSKNQDNPALLQPTRHSNSQKAEEKVSLINTLNFIFAH